MYPTNWIPAANVVALARPGLGLVFVSLARWFLVYLGLAWRPTRSDSAHRLVRPGVGAVLSYPTG